MTGNDGDDTGTHHEGRKRERAKRKGVLMMQTEGEKEEKEGFGSER